MSTQTEQFSYSADETLSTVESNGVNPAYQALCRDYLQTIAMKANYGALTHEELDAAAGLALNTPPASDEDAVLRTGISSAFERLSVGEDVPENYIAISGLSQIVTNPVLRPSEHLRAAAVFIGALRHLEYASVLDKYIDLSSRIAEATLTSIDMAELKAQLATDQIDLA